MRVVTDAKVRFQWPYHYKVEYAKQKIMEWHDFYDGKVHLMFSGGKDSTALLHLARSIYPDMQAVFVNTGLEFPDIIKFVQKQSNITWIKPAKSFKTIIHEYGYPVISKQVAEYVEQIRRNLDNLCSQVVRLRLTGLTAKNKFSQQFMLANKWQYLIDAPFKISARCCKYMKKKPAWKIEKKYNTKPIVGTLASESQIRRYSYSFLGCNAYKAEHPRSAPLSVWTAKDTWRYIKENNLDYSDIYNYGFTSTGCAFCMFGIHKDKDPNRFEIMRQYEPKLYNYCINKLGIGEVLNFLNIRY